MTGSSLTRFTRSGLIGSTVVVACLLAFAAEAGAACFTPLTGTARLKPLQFATGAAAAAVNEPAPGDVSIVGMWRSEFLLGEGPDLFDETFQQFHNDGTEMMLSRGLPPVLGNVCVGVWKQTGPRTYKLKHTAWNWDLQGQFVGIFVMEVIVNLDRRGGVYTGTWSADNLTPSGEPIAGQHFDGIVRGSRITVE
jgi:hypothetical protein